MEKIQGATIDLYDAQWIYQFAKNVKGVDIQKLQEAVIQTGSKEWMYRFARDVEGADIQRLQEVFIKLGNIEYIYHFVNDVEGADRQKLQEAITNGLDKGRLEAEEAKGDITLCEVQDAIIKTGDAYHMYQFALNVKGVDVPRLQKAVDKTKHPKYTYWFARDIEGADKSNLLQLKRELMLKGSDALDILVYAEKKWPK